MEPKCQNALKWYDIIIYFRRCALHNKNAFVYAHACNLFVTLSMYTIMHFKLNLYLDVLCIDTTWCYQKM